VLQIAIARAVSLADDDSLCVMIALSIAVGVIRSVSVGEMVRFAIALAVSLADGDSLPVGIALRLGLGRPNNVY
jgi:hypothetical protein